MSDPFGDKARRAVRLAALEAMLTDPKLDHAGRMDIRHQMLNLFDHRSVRTETLPILREQLERHKRLDRHLNTAIAESRGEIPVAVPALTNVREVVAASAQMIKRLPQAIAKLERNAGSLGETMSMVEKLSNELGEADAHVRSMLTGLGSNFGPALDEEPKPEAPKPEPPKP